MAPDAGPHYAIGPLLEIAAGFGPTVELRTLSSSTLICHLADDHRKKLRAIGVYNRTGADRSYDRVGDRTVWRARIGLASEWHFARDPATALAEAISLHDPDALPEREEEADDG